MTSYALYKAIMLVFMFISLAIDFSKDEIRKKYIGISLITQVIGIVGGIIVNSYEFISMFAVLFLMDLVSLIKYQKKS